MELLGIIIVAFVAFATRIFNLLNVPIFTDEAIYIRWAQIGLADPANRYLALTDGKQPLLTWLMYPMLKVFSDPLFAGRFVSVLSGVFAAVGIYFLAKQLFGKKVGFIASAIYIFSPFALLYDRLALMDSLLAAFGIWSLFLTVILVKKLRLDAALLLGINVGLGVLTKSSAWDYLLLTPFSLILFDFKAKNKLVRFVTWIGLISLSTIIAQVMYNSLRLSPWFYLIRQKNYSFILTVGEFLRKPFELLLPNLHGLIYYLITYLTLPVFLVICFGIFVALLEKDKKVLYLFLWFAIPFLGLASFGKVIFPRFILFMVMPLFVIAAKTISDIAGKFGKSKKILAITSLVVLAYPVYQCFLLLSSPVEAAIPDSDRNQLFNDWPSGYGVSSVISYLRQKAETSKIVIGTEGTFGLNPAVYEIYLKNNKNVEIHGYWPVNGVPRDLKEAAKNYPTYLVFKETQNVPEFWPLKLIAKYQRGDGKTYLLFYRVENQVRDELK